MKHWIIALLLVISIGLSVSSAEVPRTINYQGRLTDLSGIPLADGAWAITIRLYSNEADPEASSIWADNYTVQTKNGYFNVVLGSNPSFPLNLAFDQQYYLGIKVGTDVEMTPRQPLNSVPYSLNTLGPQLIGYRVLTAGSGTYVPTAGTRAIMVEVQGGGGGGGGAESTAAGFGAAGSGGGGGGYAKKYISELAASYPYTVGDTANGGEPDFSTGLASVLIIWKELEFDVLGCLWYYAAFINLQAGKG